MMVLLKSESAISSLWRKRLPAGQSVSHDRFAFRVGKRSVTVSLQKCSLFLRDNRQLYWKFHFFSSVSASAIWVPANQAKTIAVIAFNTNRRQTMLRRFFFFGRFEIKYSFCDSYLIVYWNWFVVRSIRWFKVRQLVGLTWTWPWFLSRCWGTFLYSSRTAWHATGEALASREGGRKREWLNDQVFHSPSAWQHACMTFACVCATRAWPKHTKGIDFHCIALLPSTFSCR